MSDKRKYTDVGSRLREIREKFNSPKISQAAFGERYSVSQAYVKNLENGSKPSLEFLLNVAEDYDVSLDWLLLGRSLDKIVQAPGRVNREKKENEISGTIHTSSHSTLMRNIEMSLDEDPAFAEWIDILLKLSPDARAMLLNFNRPNLTSTGATTNPNTALSTSPNTGEDEQAAAKSDIA
ncbi:helix-turn-helix domain-containing protein [Sporomusa sp. KB1]|jgi:transcriptional regulator with XRE-family HTH domain|uniref:helix-turn-helix domain-containing protein n=1 Tax=Sporomusa sp. KB1 TaxID=943346 RepID=UPI0011AB2688|nr:helix-turn-helix transcriptional regulator [Sporomusa sp. KB1]TWH45930.1 transcriptional regulator with XRE-family HTH domain [Sporomusa sp. KB1]